MFCHLWSIFDLTSTHLHPISLVMCVYELYTPYYSVWGHMGAYGGLKVTIFVRVSDPSPGVVFAHVRHVSTYPS